MRLAEEGADIIAVDICDQIETVHYAMATPEDLSQTVSEVEAVDRRIVARQVDVRDLSALEKAVAEGTRELGPVGIIIANAGISPHGAPEPDLLAMFRSVVDVNLTGVFNTVKAATPSMIENGQGGAIVLISSTQGLKGTGGNGSASASAYAASKHGVVGLMRSFAHWLAPYSIRINTVHPTGVPTPMVINEQMNEYIEQHPESLAAMTNLIPVDYVQPIDISNAVVWLVSDDARYVTGVTLPVDAGFNAK